MLNQCNFIGHLGKDPNCHESKSGNLFCSFSLACSEKWTDKTTGEKKESVSWVRCKSSNKLASICKNFLKKGSLVFVSGKLTTSKWHDSEGQERYTTEIFITEMKMLDKKNGDKKIKTSAYDKNLEIKHQNYDRFDDEYDGGIPF